MKKLLIALLGLAGIISCASTETTKPFVSENPFLSYAKEKRETTIPEKISLRKIRNIKFDYSTKYEPPKRLVDYLGDSFVQKIYSHESFRQEVYHMAEKRGYSKEQIRELEPLDAILLSAEITCEKLEFQSKWEDGQNIEEIRNVDRMIKKMFEEGRADCTGYAACERAIFNLFRNENEKLKNVYMLGNIFSDSFLLFDSKEVMEKIKGIKNPKEFYLRVREQLPNYLFYQCFHDWNMIFVCSPEEMQIGMIDVTLYDSDRKDLDVSDKGYVENDWKVRVLLIFEDYKKLKEIDLKKIENTKLREIVRRKLGDIK